MQSIISNVKVKDNRNKIYNFDYDLFANFTLFFIIEFKINKITIDYIFYCISFNKLQYIIHQFDYISDINSYIFSLNVFNKNEKLNN